MYTWNHANGNWDPVYTVGVVPPSRFQASFVELPGTRTAYLFGGNSEEPMNSGLYKYDIENKIWHFEGYGPLVPRLGCGMVGIDGYLYIGFGTDGFGNVISDMWRYDTVAGVWKQYSTTGIFYIIYNSNLYRYFCKIFP